MTIPLWTLLGFAVWIFLALFFTVGVIRSTNILTGRVAIKEYRADKKQGSELYQRAMRSHANCVENLPLYTVIVYLITYLKLSSPLINFICIFLVWIIVSNALM